jgi:hypothetical protein
MVMSNEVVAGRGIGGRGSNRLAAQQDTEASSVLQEGARRDGPTGAAKKAGVCKRMMVGQHDSNSI